MEIAPVELSPGTRNFYVRTLTGSTRTGVPFLVGGAFALAKHAGIERHTKDLDIFVYRDDRDRILQTLAAAGYRTEVPFPHWLAKARGEDGFIDVIYSSGNGVAEVDEEWFSHASDAEILGVPVKLCPAEEMIWSKALRPGTRTVRRGRHRPPHSLPGRGPGLGTVASPLWGTLAHSLQPPDHLRIRLPGRAREGSGARF